MAAKRTPDGEATELERKREFRAKQRAELRKRGLCEMLVVVPESERQRVRDYCARLVAKSGK